MRLSKSQEPEPNLEKQKPAASPFFFQCPDLIYLRPWRTQRTFLCKPSPRQQPSRPTPHPPAPLRLPGSGSQDPAPNTAQPGLRNEGRRAPSRARKGLRDGRDLGAAPGRLHKEPHFRPDSPPPLTARRWRPGSGGPAGRRGSSRGERRGGFASLRGLNLEAPSPPTAPPPPGRLLHSPRSRPRRAAGASDFTSARSAPSRGARLRGRCLHLPGSGGEGPARAVSERPPVPVERWKETSGVAALQGAEGLEADSQRGPRRQRARLSSLLIFQINVYMECFSSTYFCCCYWCIMERTYWNVIVVFS